MYKKILIMSIAAMSLWLTGCDDYDKFTTDRSAVLQFSMDKVVFDTLITTCPSATKTPEVPTAPSASISTVRT